ncbi:MAG: hypothetical protein ACREDR_10015, partial [Blastocatellia bacterium]
MLRWQRISSVLSISILLLGLVETAHGNARYSSTANPAAVEEFSGKGSALQSPTINLSHDLVPLGIASQNLAPNQPTLDARPLFQAAIQYIQSNPVEVLTLDKGAYYFLTPQNSTAYLRLVGLSNLTI